MQVYSLTSPFVVTPDRDVFKTSIHRERLEKMGRISWKIFSTLVFPVGIAYAFLKTYTSNNLLPSRALFDLPFKEKCLVNLIKKNETSPSRKSEAKIDLLLNEIHEINKYKLECDSFIRNKNNHAHRVAVQTADGVDLDTLMIQHPNQLTLPTSEQKWVVFSNPNIACFEIMTEFLKAISDKTGANVYTGNYRGVMNSKGRASSSHELVRDGEAMVQKLLSAGVPAKNILLHGWSLGGAVATKVGAQHQEEGNEMHACNDRSFASLAHTIDALKPAAGLFGKAAWVAGWSFDSVADFKKIKGHKFIVLSRNDEIIHYKKASLYKVFKKTHPTEVRFPRIKIEEAEAEERKHLLPANFIKFNYSIYHCFPLTLLDQSFEAYAEQVKTALKLKD